VKSLVVGVIMRLPDKFNSWLRILRFSVEDRDMNNENKKVKFEFEFKLLYREGSIPRRIYTPLVLFMTVSSRQFSSTEHMAHSSTVKLPVQCALCKF
jgi:hypothetical protein